MQVPRQLSTWLKGMQTRYVPGISVPHLWGGGEEYGIDYPLDVVPEEGTAGPEEAADILETGVRAGTFRAPTIIRGPGGEEESFNVPPPSPEPPSRQKVIEIFNETYGNPDTYNPEAETAKVMGDESVELKKSFGLDADIDPKHMTPEVRKEYNRQLAVREQQVYERKVAYRKRIKDHRDEVLKTFDKQQKARTAARKEIREEERLAIARSAELRALGKPPATKRVWDTKLDKYVQRTDAQITKDPDRYGMTKETALEMKKAGATQIALGKYGLQLEATAGNIRTQLVANKRDKNFYEASGKIFNMTNTKNEVAYWKSITPGLERQGIRIIKLTKEEIADGVTPKKIQEFADRNGVTIERVINEMRKK